MNKYNSAMVSVFLATVLSVPIPVWGQTTGTLIITEDTTLTEDHLDRIVVVANGVTLDCKGFSVTGSGRFSGVGISIFSTGVTIKECHVSNFFEGFRLHPSSSDNILIRNTANNNFSNGFAIQTSSRNIFKKNTSNDNGVNFTFGGAGFAFDSSSDNVLKQNTSTGNITNGFAFGHSFGPSPSTGNVLEKNTAIDNGNWGFVLVSGASNNVLKKNTSTNNSIDGFNLQSSHGNILEKILLLITIGMGSNYSAP